ncbi:MMPL family transporter [Candidatus Solirubrobacter pratensis]|uniref:MMPL family transporter n=1 Tax=Candidatus Solirubrobacter pratensis TaxID=1298857 RepID=UPI0003FF7B3A|nr:MMPL family transporter [Candidatus Solirubrobacter pratensis]
MLGRIAVLALGRRARWVTVGAWLALAVALAGLQPKLQARAADESKTFLTRGADSTRVSDLLDERFPEGRDSTAVIAYVSRRGQVLLHSREMDAHNQALCADRALPALKGVGGPDGPVCGELGHVLGPETPPSPISDDFPESTLLVTAINGRDDTDSVAHDVAAMRATLPGPAGNPLASYVTGPAGFDADRSAAVEGIDGKLLAITMAMVVALMLLTYRSPLIAGVMLGVVAIAYVIATGAIYGLVAAGATSVSGQSTAILIVLMFGAGTDYCLLIVSRYRDELRGVDDVDAALARAARRTGPAILASGAIVVASMLVLGLAGFRATREMGPILALGIVVMMACGVTLLPATLAVLGRRAFWPARPRAEGSGRGWARVAQLVERRPRLLVAVSIALLAAGALGNLEGRGYLDLSEQYRTKPEAVAGQELIRRRFPAGRVAPLDVLASSEVNIEVRDALRRTPGISSADTDSQSRDGTLVSLEALLDVDPFSKRAMDLIPRLREVARRAAGGHVALIGGITAENHDNLEALRTDAKLIVPLVLGLIFVVLVLLLRAIVAPLYVIATVLLSFAFALGASSLVFTHVFGQPDSDPNLPIFAFIFLVALGVDDIIFLLTRVREEHRRGLSTHDAVLAGLRSTGGVITSAGLILAGTFAALMALDLEALFQVGFTVGLGLLVDAFLVRTFLVPSLAVMLGERNWWPA